MRRTILILAAAAALASAAPAAATPIRDLVARAALQFPRRAPTAHKVQAVDCRPVIREVEWTCNLVWTDIPGYPTEMIGAPGILAVRWGTVLIVWDPYWRPWMTVVAR